MDAKILAQSRKDNKISTEKLGMTLGVSYKTIRRHIKAMGNVHYIGRGFSGHWEIHDKS
ncbi:MAG: AsnC family protein [Gemmiger formicilis]|uniref:AsnC family protein n=1 Tax=Gemmiger formicilis TaxID=745368 RepID=UPI0039A2BA33